RLSYCQQIFAVQFHLMRAISSSCADQTTQRQLLVSTTTTLMAKTQLSRSYTSLLVGRENMVVSCCFIVAKPTSNQLLRWSLYKIDLLHFVRCLHTGMLWQK